MNKKIEEFVYDTKGRICGVTSEGITYKCKAVIADPSYFPEKTKLVGQIARCICILDHPIPNTNESKSCQIILPRNQFKRQNDIYICCVSSDHHVAPEGIYIVTISTIVETNDPRKEIQPAVDLLEDYLHIFFSVQPIHVPINDPNQDGVFISNSYDGTTHFETIANDVIRIYKEFTGLDDVSHIFIPNNEKKITNL